jgi:hypothetical protein
MFESSAIDMLVRFYLAMAGIEMVCGAVKLGHAWWTGKIERELRRLPSESKLMAEQFPRLSTGLVLAVLPFSLTVHALTHPHRPISRLLRLFGVRDNDGKAEGADAEP